MGVGVGNRIVLVTSAVKIQSINIARAPTTRGAASRKKLIHEDVRALSPAALSFCAFEGVPSCLLQLPARFPLHSCVVFSQDFVVLVPLVQVREESLVLLLARFHQAAVLVYAVERVFKLLFHHVLRQRVRSILVVLLVRVQRFARQRLRERLLHREALGIELPDFGELRFLVPHQRGGFLVTVFFLFKSALPGAAAWRPSGGSCFPFSQKWLSFDRRELFLQLRQRVSNIFWQGVFRCSFQDHLFDYA
mmetsp:Transcript_27240/g.68723  ORF Transcript_27240/g.68723 Transcript_27240/m.68723 type:complete len:249 (+) Transcript_27240:566-1312(+)